MAIQEVRTALSGIGSARDGYTGELARAMTNMQADGYLPDAIDAADGSGVNATDVARNEATEYGEQQRAADQALSDSGGPMTAEKEAAEARLRDFATIQNPNADPAAMRLAGERLDDFQTSRKPSGALPRDPILGADPQHRALVRQEWQRQLEKGSPWMPPMTTDEATLWLDQQESIAKSEAIDTAVKGLESKGIPHDQAVEVVDAASGGVPWSDLGYAADVAGSLQPLELVDGGLSDGKHALPWERYSPETLKTISGFGKALGAAGTILQISAAWNEANSGAPPGATWGGLAGSLGGGTAGGAAAGFVGGWTLGPGGAFVGTVVGGLVGGTMGKAGGEAVGGLFDQ